MPTVVILLGIVTGLDFIALDMWATGLPLALHAAGFGEAWIGWLAGWMGIAALVQRPFLASYGDRRGHWPVLALSLLAAVVGSLLWHAPDRPALQLAARTLQGTSLAGIVVASQALMVALAPVDRRGRALALQGLADTGGVMAGATLGEWAWLRWGHRGLWVGSAAVGAAAVLLALATRRRHGRTQNLGDPLPAPNGAGPRQAPGWRRRLASAADLPPPPAEESAGRTGRTGSRGIPLLILGGAVGTVFGGILNLTALHAATAGYRAGTWLGVFALVSIAARFGTGFLLDRGRNPAPLLTTAFLIMAAGSLLMAGVNAAATAWTAAAILALGYGVAHITLITSVVATAPPPARGAAAGFLANAMDLGTGLGVALLGAILEATSFGIMYGTMAATAVAGALVAALNSRGRRPVAARSRNG